MKTMIVVKNASGDYWDNGWGWITLEDDEDECPFTIFTEEEMKTLDLPIGGHWEILD